MNDVGSEYTVHTIRPIVKTISPIEADTIIEIGIGCQGNCPCRLMVNCSYYNTLADTKRWKELRGDEKKFLTGIWEYYVTIFKITFEMPESNMNG